MKFLFGIIILQLTTTACYSQLLEGTWKGSYSTNYHGRQINQYSPIELNFIISNDSSYSVFSYSNGHSKFKVIDKIKCSVQCKFITNDSIYLKELEILEPLGANLRCMKQMLLRIIEKKNKIILDGIWLSETPECDVSGEIIFVRKKKNLP
jgi:hypothetical protein